MPSSITHAYIGLETLKKLNNKPRSIIEKNINNYKVYCQNMDVLYFYHIMFLKRNAIQDLGHSYHNKKVYQYFEMFINDNKQNKNEELFTFIAGMITHYKADSIIHPYINYLAHSNKKIDEIDKHFAIETYIDNYLVNKNITSDYLKYNNANFLFNYTKEKIIKEEITKVTKKIFHYDDVGTKYYQALKEMQFVFKHVRYDRLGLKKKIYQLIDLNPFNIRRTKYLSYHFILDNDEYYLNLNHQNWLNYFNKKNSKKSFLDLYKEALDSSTEIINELYEYIFEDKKISLFDLIGNNSYSTGLPIDSPNKK